MPSDPYDGVIGDAFYVLRRAWLVAAAFDKCLLFADASLRERLGTDSCPLELGLCHHRAKN